MMDCPSTTPVSSRSDLEEVRQSRLLCTWHRQGDDNPQGRRNVRLTATAVRSIATSPLCIADSLSRLPTGF